MEGLNKLTLGNLNSGAAAELVDQAIAAVIENIEDPNYPTKKAREIVLRIVFTPDERDNSADVLVSVQTKLPARYGHRQRAYLMPEGEGAVLVQGADPLQMQMQLGEGVVQMKEEKASG